MILSTLLRDITMAIRAEATEIADGPELVLKLEDAERQAIALERAGRTLDAIVENAQEDEIRRWDCMGEMRVSGSVV